MVGAQRSRNTAGAACGIASLVIARLHTCVRVNSTRRGALQRAICEQSFSVIPLNVAFATLVSTSTSASLFWATRAFTFSFKVCAIARPIVSTM